MMNGRRKSDRPVVATKPANKVGATANKVAASMAERVERRGLAKGKPPGQNTNRAQDREVVQSVDHLRLMACRLMVCCLSSSRH